MARRSTKSAAAASSCVFQSRGQGTGDREAGTGNPISSPLPNPQYDIIYIGGALGAIHAALMAKLGYKVLLVERMPFLGG